MVSYLLLLALLDIALNHDTLSQELLGTVANLNIQKSRVTLLDVTDAESAQTNLNHGSVVQDLERDVRVVDALLQVRHEDEIARLEPAVVQRVMVNMAQDGLCAQSVCRVVLVDELAQAVYYLGALLLVALVVFVVHVLDFLQVDATHLLLVFASLDVRLLK